MKNTKILLELVVELENLLLAINDNYETNKDEFINEKFFDDMHKAKELSNTLKNMLKRHD